MVAVIVSRRWVDGSRCGGGYGAGGRGGRSLALRCGGRVSHWRGGGGGGSAVGSVGSVESVGSVGSGERGSPYNQLSPLVMRTKIRRGRAVCFGRPSGVALRAMTSPYTQPSPLVARTKIRRGRGGVAVVGKSGNGAGAGDFGELCPQR